MRIATCLFSIAVLCAFTAPAEAACRWDGTGPACRGKCNASEIEVERQGPSWYVPFGTAGSKKPGFGAACFTGSKALCCKRCTPGLVWLDPPGVFDKTCVTPAERAAAQGTQPALSTPNAQFCEWYASEAAKRAAQGAKCGLTGALWNPRKGAHVTWCMKQQTQQKVWGRHNERLASLADCTRKEVEAAKATPGGGHHGAGAPMVTVKRNVDVYKEPGGVGQPIGMLRIGSRPQMYETRPDKWCRLAGNQVPGGGGWVWCGEGFELR